MISRFLFLGLRTKFDNTQVFHSLYSTLLGLCDIVLDIDHK